MSTTNNAMIIVGLPTTQIDDIDELGLEVYDYVCGFVYQETTDYDEFHYDEIQINTLKNDFFDLTGLRPNVYLTSWSY